MQDFSLHRLSDEDAVRLYEWTERSSSAVLKCTCQQVRRMKTLPELSYAIGALIYPGQTLFLHYETPALFAEVCGMVVGLTVKEDQISYEVDDGTSVLRILETRKSLRQSETRPDQPGSDATVPCGIPECYIMPAQPKASTSTSRLDNSAPTVILPALQPRFEVGDIVRCTGKMQIDLGGQRFIVARRMVRCDNMNMECYHQLDVIKAEMDVYRKPFDWSRVETTRKGPMAKQTTSHRAGRKTPARLILSDLSPNEKAASAPWILADPGQQSYAGRQRLSEETARRLLSGDTLLSSRSTHPASVPCPPREHERTQSSRSSKSIIRPLRAPAKISDQKLTESYFQLQVQQHISLHYHSQSFALSDLQIDKTLSTLAQRLVRIRLQHRLSARPAGSSPDISLISTEQQQDKIHRLFEWAIRKMMQDGFITLADEDHSKQPRASHENDTDSSETYRLVTAEYLLRPLSLLLGNRLLVSPHDIAVQDVDDLLARLRILDDRFRNVDRCLFQDSLALYRVRCTPIVID